MQVQIRNVNVEWVGEGRKKYGKASVEYSYNGEARRQNVMSFTNPDVFKKVQELQGQTVEVEVGKNDKGYSEWRSVSSVNGSASANAPSAAPGATMTRVSGSNYETKEERAARQVLIVKQSSLAVAKDVLIHNAGKDKVDPEAVKALALSFSEFVFDNAPDDDDGSIQSMKNDPLPF